MRVNNNRKDIVINKKFNKNKENMGKGRGPSQAANITHFALADKILATFAIFAIFEAYQGPFPFSFVVFVQFVLLATFAIFAAVVTG